MCNAQNEIEKINQMAIKNTCFRKVYLSIVFIGGFEWDPNTSNVMVPFLAMPADYLTSARTTVTVAARLAWHTAWSLARSSSIIYNRRRSNTNRYNWLFQLIMLLNDDNGLCSLDGSRFFALERNTWLIHSETQFDFRRFCRSYSIAGPLNMACDLY